MNRQQLSCVRAVALFMSFIVASLTIGNLLTVASHGIDVDIPEESDVNWSIDLENKEILFRTGFSVENNGAFDISDIDISADLVKDDTRSMISFLKEDMVVLRGSNKSFDILVSLDLNKISLIDWFTLLYQETTLKLLIDIDAKYMFNLIDFNVDEVIEIPWAPPIATIDENESLKTAISGISKLLNLVEHSSLQNFTNISDIISILSIPSINYTSENGVTFQVQISNYTETIKQIDFRIVTPLLLMDGNFEMKSSILIGFNGISPVLNFEEVKMNYVK